METLIEMISTRETNKMLHIGLIIEKTQQSLYNGETII
jgi:hypothetical protein